MGDGCAVVKNGELFVFFCNAQTDIQETMAQIKEKLKAYKSKYSFSFTEFMQFLSC